MPLVIVAHTAHYFIRPDEIIYDAASTLDKTIAFNEGAVHGGGPCAPCALQIDPTLTPAQANAYFGDTQGREVISSLNGWRHVIRIESVWHKGSLVESWRKSSNSGSECWLVRGFCPGLPYS